MRYLFTGLVLLSLIGCGSSGTTSTEGDTIVKPTTPIIKDSSKQPPAIPNI